MKITIFNGSPRKERGITHLMVSQFEKGARTAGAESQTIFLAGKKIGMCQACYSCWTKTPGRCVIKDDMSALIDEYLSSDLVVFAMPVYVDNVPGLMKVFIDRLIATGDPHMEPDEQGETRHRKVHSKPTKIAAISSCGYPEQTHFEVMRVLFRRMARNFHCELVAEIYRAGAALLTAPVPELKPVTDRYFSLLQQAGSEIVTLGIVTKILQAQLEQPLTPFQADASQYRAAANQRWDAIAASNH